MTSSLSLACTTPHGFRATTSTRCTAALARHSSNTPSPTMPVAPVRMTFMARGVRGSGGKRNGSAGLAPRDLDHVVAHEAAGVVVVHCRAPQQLHGRAGQRERQRRGAQVG